jgi:hypothetical protein
MRLRRDRDGGGEDKIEWEETGKVATKTRQEIALLHRSWHQNSSTARIDSFYYHVLTMGTLDSCPTVFA